MSRTLTDTIDGVKKRIDKLQSENERLITINKEQQTSHELYLETWLKNIKGKTETYESQYNELNKMYGQLKKNCANRDDVKADGDTQRAKLKAQRAAAAERKEQREVDASKRAQVRAVGQADRDARQRTAAAQRQANRLGGGRRKKKSKSKKRKKRSKSKKRKNLRKFTKKKNSSKSRSK